MTKIKIYTKYEGPTETRGARIIALCNGKRESMPYNHALSPTGNRMMVVVRLADRLNIDTFDIVWR